MPSIPPLAVLASWPRVNNVNPELQPVLPILLLSVILGFFSTTGVGLRLYLRIRAKQVYLEDALLVIGLIFSLALSAVCCWAAYNAHWRVHMWDLVDKIPVSVPLLQCVYAAKLLHGFGLATSRTSVVLFFKRLFYTRAATTKWWLWFQRFVIIFINTTLFAFVFTEIFMCRPVKAYWNILYPGQKCLPEGAIVLTFGIASLFCDVLVTVLPLPILLKLSMPLYQRITVWFVLCLGSCAIICAGVKAYYIYMALIGSYDQTWWLIPLWICGIVENNIVIICACIPDLHKPLLSSPLKRFAKILGMTRNSRASSNRPKESYVKESFVKESYVNESEHHLPSKTDTYDVRFSSVKQLQSKLPES